MDYHMINLTPALEKIEIQFLKSLISLMQTSPFVRRTIPVLYQVFKEHTSKVTVLAITGSVLTGGSIGFLLGLFSVFF